VGQSFSYILLHLVISTRERTKAIDDSIKLKLYKYFVEASACLNCQILEVGGMEDHVHVMLLLDRGITMTQYINEIKSVTTRWIKSLGERYSNFAWQHGYGVFSVSQFNTPGLRAYIRNQREYHRHMDFKEEMRNIYRAYDLAIDERYVWD